MFENATYRIEHADGLHFSSYEGAVQVRTFCEQTRLYPDGTPRTKHVITNVIIELDGDRARPRGAMPRFSSRQTCCRSNPSLRVGTSTSSNGSAAGGGSPTDWSPVSSSEIAASTSPGTRARPKMPPHDLVLVTLGPPMQADMNWFAVLAHHASRTPDKPITVFENETVTYGEMAAARRCVGCRAARTRGPLWRRRGPALVQLHRVRGDDLCRQLPRRDRDADQLAARSAGDPLHPRPLRGARARVRRITHRSRERSDEGPGSHPFPCLYPGTGSRRVDTARRAPHRDRTFHREPAPPATTSTG